MTYALIDHTVGQSVDGTTVTTPALDTTGARVIAIIVTWASGSTGIVTDSKGNTYAYRPHEDTPGSTLNVQTAYVLDPVVGAGHTWTFNAGVNNYPSMAVMVFSGPPSSVDHSANGAACASCTSTGGASFVPERINALIVSGLGQTALAQAEGSIDSGFTLTDAARTTSPSWGVAAAFKVKTAISGDTPTWSWTGLGGGSMVINGFVPLPDPPPSSSQGSLSVSYFRLFNGSLPTFENLENGALCGVAVTPGVTTDTPLIAVTDLTDVSQTGTGHPWVAVGSLETLLPGPLTADTSFMLMPEGDSPYGHGAGNPTLVVAGLATTIGSPQSTTAVNAIIDPTEDPTVAMCGRREGGWWQACDNAGRGNKTDFIDFGLPGPTHLLASDVLACNGPLPSLQVRRDLLELPTKDLVSVVRSTMRLTRFTRLDGTAVQSYSLIITSALGLDAAVNTAGNRILYLNVEDGSIGPTEVKAYALDTDTDLGGLFRIPGVAWSLMWLPDCTFLVVVQDGATVNVQRYNLRGKLIRTYDLGTLPVGDGVCGIAASVAQDRLWVVTAWDNGESPEQPAVIRFKLSTGVLLGPEVPLLGELTAYTGIACMTQPYYENKCVPVAPPPSSVRQWALERFDLTDRQEQTS